MKLQMLKLRLVRITFYTFQQPSKIMHNLYPNSINDLSWKILDVLQVMKLLDNSYGGKVYFCSYFF